jgi:hypothetical protein
MASYCDKQCIGCNRRLFASISLCCNNYYIMRQTIYGNMYKILQQSPSVAKRPRYLQRNYSPNQLKSELRFIYLFFLYSLFFFLRGRASLLRHSPIDSLPWIFHRLDGPKEWVRWLAVVNCRVTSTMMVRRTRRQVWCAPGENLAPTSVDVGESGHCSPCWRHRCGAFTSRVGIWSLVW